MRFRLHTDVFCRKGRKMKKRILALCSAALILAFCGCSTGGANDADSGSDRVSVKADEDKVTYQIDTEQEFSEVGGKVVERTADEPEVSAPDGSITLEQAKKIVDSCAFEQFYLPSAVADYKKYYYGTVELNDKSYYSMCFYAEKNSVRMFAGTDFYVSCDGEEVLRCDWSGNLTDAEPGGNSKDKSEEELYKNAKISAVDALFLLNNVEAEKIGLTEKLNSYTFEIDAGLSEKRGIKCYCITPKLKYENGTKLGKSIYVAADGTDAILMFNENTNDYEQVK